MRQLLILVFYTLALSSSTNLYSVSSTIHGVFSIYTGNGNSLVYRRIPTLESGLFSLPNDEAKGEYIEWYTPAGEHGQSGKITPLVYRTGRDNVKGYHCYSGKVIEWNCTTSLSSYGSLQCKAGNTSAFDLTLATLPDIGWHLNTTELRQPLSPAATNALLGTMCAHLDYVRTKHDKIQWIAENNDMRRSQGCMMSTLLYTIITLCALSLSMLSISCATWLCPLYLWYNTHSDSMFADKQEWEDWGMKVTLAIWLIIHVLLLAVGFLVWRAPSMLCACVVMFIFVIFTSICYACSHGHRYKFRLLHMLSGVVTLVSFITGVVVFLTWNSHDYYLWNRNNDIQELEHQPSTIAKALLMMYSCDTLATDLNYNVFAELATRQCMSYRTDTTNKNSKIKEFIDEYNINMNSYSPSNYTMYATVNEWFIRRLAPGVRPISNSSFSVCVSPADSRAMFFTHMRKDSAFWIKSSRVNVKTMIQNDASNFDGAAMAIYRLAPQDYHRFHAPVDGKIVSVTSLGGTILSVSADATQSNNAVFLNQRKVVMIDTPDIGKVAYIAIGAMCVGSVVITKPIGSIVKKGDEIGYMQFGSTVVVLYEANRVRFDSDLVYSSSSMVESKVLMGSRNCFEN